MTTYTGTRTIIDLKPITCSQSGCGVTFALDAQYIRDRRNDHQTWYCPNGHPRYYPDKSDEEKLRDELAARDRSLDAARSLARREAERRQSAERRRAAAQGQVTKIKRRVGRGVCPCCNRTFADLARHMEGQHPEFAADVVTT